MSWQDVREWAPIVIALVTSGGLTWQWLMRKQFATTDSVVSVHKVLDDQDREQSARITTALHRLDLMEKDIKQLPDYDTVNKLRDDIGELKEGQATTRGKLDGIKESVDLLRDSLVRIDEFLRAKP
ncbi:MAG: DUF2730 family protein [Alphaproteobacteria bacterium]|nr:DUF2730 family protein [Alphaproteobacteria bacterium]